MSNVFEFSEPKPIWTLAIIEQERNHAAWAESVRLPIDQFLPLLDLAELGLLSKGKDNE